MYGGIDRYEARHLTQWMYGHDAQLRLRAGGVSVFGIMAAWTSAVSGLTRLWSLVSEPVRALHEPDAGQDPSVPCIFYGPYLSAKQVVVSTTPLSVAMAVIADYAYDVPCVWLDAYRYVSSCVIGSA